MKKLICTKDVEKVITDEEKIFYIDGSEIITPAARDFAKNNGIVFKIKTNESKIEKIVNKKDLNMENFDCEMMLNLFKKMMDKGLLKEMLQCLKQDNFPFEVERHSSGLKVVRGNTVKMDVFDTGNPDAKVYFQELVNKDESKISAGFLIIDNSKFDWELSYEEIDYVIEGTLAIEINGKTYVAYPGDVLFVPSGSRVVWSSPDKARIFYATYPANWADLL
ncbi:cupin domain-containing protein [Clostridium botulinum]|uniref:Ethanolamine utilization protein EutQ n=1 Tax=Clostridium botulinum TaxID=1491 RepID=A0A9Q1UXB5_CLOBO|nr:cupin domain-containing protein [Clostridium botulinum]KEI01258.1 ethanolamine utilization protein EutQ [Clostridium botulinum D str. 16868]KEI04870.1 ethanolamine utilization protein EutQ [Clostridium botulinum C/D str. Sp77]KLU75946.1 ethanolamine utilization protein EutQ [Clostridium botulinum V891]KOA75612.1 ethanolamine utilization protein EutQ [Clostridium botulinum]KOA76769.1 ethanolamine utilization protein EutQ [Clostridium botulinum]